MQPVVIGGRGAMVAPVPIGVARKPGWECVTVWARGRKKGIGVWPNLVHCTLVISVAYAIKGVDIRHRMGIIEVQAGTKQHRRGRRGHGETARA